MSGSNGTAHADFSDLFGNIPPGWDASIDESVGSAEHTNRLKALRDSSREVVLQKGDEVEIAHSFVDRLKALGDGLVSTYERFHQYDPATGAWERYDKDRILSAIDTYSDASVAYIDKKTDEEKTRPLMVSARLVDGIYRIALRCNVVARDDYFATASPGVLFSNGFAALVDGVVTLLPFSPDHRARHPLPYAFDLGADVRPWTGFVEGLFRDDEDRDQKAAVLQEFVGAALLGVATQYKACLVLTGSGANGKSTFIEIVDRLFAPDGLTAIAPQEWSRSDYVSSLSSARFNRCNELPENDILSSEKFKAIITGEVVSARELYKAPYNFTPRSAHLFACNSLPGTTDHSDGFWRRFLIIGFNRRFEGAGTETKSAVVERITAILPSVALWALHGAARLIRNGGYTVLPSSEQAKAQWRTDSNSAAGWVENDDLVHTEDRPDFMRASRAYGQYREWCKDNGFLPVSSVKFAARLKALGVRAQRRTDGVYYGLRRKAEN